MILEVDNSSEENISDDKPFKAFGLQIPSQENQSKLLVNSDGMLFPKSKVIRKFDFEIYPYREFNEQLTGDPEDIKATVQSLVRIISVEGPVIAKRACDIYLRSVGIKHMDCNIKTFMHKAIQRALSTKEIESCNEMNRGDFMNCILRVFGSDPLIIRTRGNRSFQEITPSEIQFIAKYFCQKGVITNEG